MDTTLHELHQFPDSQLPLLFPTHARNGCGPQWHKDMELLYCTDGTGTLICNGIEHTMQPGHIYVINANELHTALDRGGLLYHCMIIDDEFLLQNCIPTGSLSIETDIADCEASRIYDDIVTQIETNPPHYAARIRGLLLLLIVRLLECSSNIAPENTARLQDPDAPIKLAVDFINGNYTKKLTLDEIAAVAGFSKPYFASRFKKSIGMTVVEYINLVRCRKAKKLLEQKELPIQQIANQCGFENTSYFSKTFRETMGMLPSAVRKKTPQS